MYCGCYIYIKFTNSVNVLELIFIDMQNMTIINPGIKLIIIMLIYITNTGNNDLTAKRDAQQAIIYQVVESDVLVAIFYDFPRQYYQLSTGTTFLESLAISGHYNLCLAWFDKCSNHVFCASREQTKEAQSHD